MKSNQSKQESIETAAIDFELQPVEALEMQQPKTENYDGGFHIQSTAVVSNKRIISKRSALQEFTCS